MSKNLYALVAAAAAAAIMPSLKAAETTIAMHDSTLFYNHFGINYSQRYRSMRTAIFLDTNSI